MIQIHMMQITSNPLIYFNNPVNLMVRIDQYQLVKL